jgi:hypothetical protein
VGHNSRCLDELWTKTLSAFSRDYMLCKLCYDAYGKTTKRHTMLSENY